MAGKLHTHYASYSGVGSARSNQAPEQKRFRAYAEGFNAKRAGALQTTNPHPAWQLGDASSDYTAWDQGWLDSNAGFNSTHVG